MNRARLLRLSMGIALFVLASAAMTYALAWGAMVANYKRWFIAPGVGGPRAPDPTHWPGRTPYDVIQLHHAADFIQGQTPANFPDSATNSPGSQRSNELGFCQSGPDRCQLRTAVAGWPCPALLGERRRISSRAWDESATRWQEINVRESTWWALTLADDAQAAARFGPGENPRILPLRPLWPGFLFNTLANAAVLTVPVGAVLARRLTVARRRSRRLAEGCCPACGYRLNGLAKCPECGAGIG